MSPLLPPGTGSRRGFVQQHSSRPPPPPLSRSTLTHCFLRILPRGKHEGVPVATANKSGLLLMAKKLPGLLLWKLANLRREGQNNHTNLARNRYLRLKGCLWLISANRLCKWQHWLPQHPCPNQFMALRCHIICLLHQAIQRHAHPQRPSCCSTPLSALIGPTNGASELVGFLGVNCGGNCGYKHDNYCRSCKHADDRATGMA